MTKRLSPDPDLEALVSRLNSTARGDDDGEIAGESGDSADGIVTPVRGREPAAVRWPLPPAGEEGGARARALIAEAAAAAASDLLFVAGAPPSVRVDGRLRPLVPAALDRHEVAALCAALVPAERRASAETTGSTDFSLRATAGRLRCNVHRQRGCWSAALRFLPAVPHDLEALHLPPDLARFCELEQGLVLVTGPTGCGKSTTLAALVRGILERRRIHLVTVEDPLEYEHDHPGSVVEHIEVGSDTVGFADVLRSVLRHDPDVIQIGEMRDAESIALALSAAETGHLVLSTLHTGDAVQSVHRILDHFASDEGYGVRAQLAECLTAVVSQQLLPRRAGGGRVPAVEVLVATPAVRHLIRTGRTANLRQQIALERQAGMLDLDESLARLVHAGLVDRAAARARARTPDEFDRRSAP